MVVNIHRRPSLGYNRNGQNRNRTQQIVGRIQTVELRWPDEWLLSNRTGTDTTAVQFEWVRHRLALFVAYIGH